MFAYIEGRLSGRSGDSVILETGGVGFRIHTSTQALARFGQEGGTVRAYTYLCVREDSLTLYGFPTQEELTTFEMLLTVSAVGPKVACGVLSAIPPGPFALAVVTGDVKALTRAPGIGKKGAERIILELKDRLRDRRFREEETAAGFPAGGDGAGGDRFDEACSALLVLGYSSGDAMQAVRAVFDPDAPLEELVRKALKRLAR